MFCKSSSGIIRGGGEKTLRISGDLNEGRKERKEKGSSLKKEENAQKSKKEEKEEKKKTPPLPPLSSSSSSQNTHLLSRLLARAKAIIH